MSDLDGLENLSTWRKNWVGWSLADKVAAIQELVESCMSSVALLAKGPDGGLDSLMKALSGVPDDIQHAVKIAEKNWDKCSASTWETFQTVLDEAFEKVLETMKDLHLLKNERILHTPPSKAAYAFSSTQLSLMERRLESPGISLLIVEFANGSSPTDHSNRDQIDRQQFAKNEFAESNQPSYLSKLISRPRRPPSPHPSEQKTALRTRPAPPQLYTEKLASQIDRPHNLALGPWADLDLVNRWVAWCDSNHGDHCQLSDSLRATYHMRPKWLIDLGKQCLVPGQDVDQYFALSYVWGNNAQTNQTTRKMLYSMLLEGYFAKPNIAAHIPKTIFDAMRLTSLLQQRYLWVDSFCIVQDDPDEMKEQLEAMTSIYANASLTIVGIVKAASEGLRGIENLTRPFRRQANAASTLHGTIKQHQQHVKNSMWSSRGWTFQEQILSRRVLVISESQISWECHCAVWVEGLEPTEGQCQTAVSNVCQSATLALDAGIEEYGRHVRAYNKRDFKQEDDVVRAFAGILTALTPKFQGGFATGLPIDYFDVTLLWRNERSLARRYLTSGKVNGRWTLPSWSWMNYVGDVLLDLWTAQLHQHLTPLVKWEYKINLGQEWKAIVGVSEPVLPPPPPPPLPSPQQLGINVGWRWGESVMAPVNTAVTAAFGIAIGASPASSTAPTMAPITPTTSTTTQQTRSVSKPAIQGPSWEMLKCPLYLRTTAEKMQVSIATKLSQWSIAYGVSTPSTPYAGHLTATRSQGLSIGSRCEIIAISETSIAMDIIQWSIDPKTTPERDEWRAKLGASPLSTDTNDGDHHHHQNHHTQRRRYLNVLWIEWFRGIAYRKGIGQIALDIWNMEKQAGRVNRIDVVLG